MGNMTSAFSPSASLLCVSLGDALSSLELQVVAALVTRDLKPEKGLKSGSEKTIHRATGEDFSTRNSL